MNAPGLVRSALALLLALSVARTARGETVRVVVVDPVTHEPVPCRLSVRTGDGEFQWGKDLAGEPYRHGGLPRVWSSGESTLTVEPGEVEVLASRPFSRLPSRATITVNPGAESTVTLPLPPLVDLRALGWFGGDAHTHVVHGERHYTVDLRETTRLARAEGLDWAAFGEVWTSAEERQPTPAERSALCRELTDELFLCTWTREHPKDHLGHMAAFPLGVDRSFAEAVGANAYSTSPEAREAFAHFEILRSLRALGGLSVYTHPAREYGGTPESVGNIARELPFDAVAAPDVLEGLDVLTDAPNNGANLRVLSFLLDRGHRLAVCGFSDACYDRRGERPGDTRTYVFLGEEPRTMKNLIAAVRAGRTFASTGPLVVAAIDGRAPGSELPGGDGTHELTVRAWNAVDYEDPRRDAFVRRIEVVRNGEVWKSLDVEPEQHTADWRVPVHEPERAWYQVRVHGSSTRQLAVTSPFWIGPWPRPKAALARVRGRVTAPGDDAPSGRVQAIEYRKGHRRTIAETALEKGLYRIECPATSRILIEVAGCEPALKSVFLDADAIYVDLFRGIRRDRLWDAEFYAEIARRLDDVTLDFELAAARPDSEPSPAGSTGR